MGKINSNNMLSSFAKISKQWGLSEPVGRVWGFLLFSSKEVNQEQIEAGTEYSRGLVSRALTKLKELKMINIIRKGKVYFYSANTSLIRGFDNIITNFLENELESTIQTLSKNVTKINEKVVRQQVQRIIKEYKKLKIGMLIFSKIMESISLLTIENLRKTAQKYSINI